VQILLACVGTWYSASATGESGADAAACDMYAPGYSGTTADGIGAIVQWYRPISNRSFSVK